MTEMLVLDGSSYVHIETMAQPVAEGARETGAEVTIPRVPELVPAEVAAKVHYKTDQAAPVATVDDLVDYDAIVVGTPTRFGNMAAQMKNFLDQTGALWSTGKLVGKVGSVFTSTASQHGGLPYAFQGQLTLAEVSGGAPYGASTIAAGDASRQPSGNELDGARFQGRHVAQIATKLAG